jgi:hypothetical protein
LGRPTRCGITNGSSVCRGADGAARLRLHAVRDFAYTIVFGSLAWLTWDGLLRLVFAAVLLARLSSPVGLPGGAPRPLPGGERVMHAVMGIVYGTFLATLAPHLLEWAGRPTGFGRAEYGLLSWVLSVMAVGVFLSGVRDLAASWAARPAVKGD